MFWNIAGFINKCKEVEEYVERFNIKGLTET